MTILDRSSTMVSMNRLTKDERVRVISALVEGNSIRATVRMTGIAKNTVAKLLCDIGNVCEERHDEVMGDLPWKRHSAVTLTTLLRSSCMDQRRKRRRNPCQSPAGNRYLPRASLSRLIESDLGSSLRAASIAVFAASGRSIW